MFKQTLINLLSPGTSNDFPPSESNMGIPNDTRGPTDVYIRECGDTARARLKYRFYLLSAQGRIYMQLRSMLSAQGRIYTSNHVYILICLGCSINPYYREKDETSEKMRCLQRERYKKRISLSLWRLQ